MKKGRMAVLTVFMLLNTLMSGCFLKPKVHLIITVPALLTGSVLYPGYGDVQGFLNGALEEFASQYKQADVTYTVHVFDYVDEVEAISETFDTPDAPDLLFEGFFNMAGYIHTGRVVPLDDAISVSLKEDLDEASLKAGQLNGKTYMMPFSSMQNVLVCNQDLFEQCGLGEYVKDPDHITNWSLEDWEYILDTLAEKLPEGVYPMPMFAKNNQGDTHIMLLMRMFGAQILDENGNFNFTDPKAIEALEWIQKGVDRGWYAPNPQNLEMSDCFELYNTGRMAMAIVNNSSLQRLNENINSQQLVNFPGNMATAFISGFAVLDNGDEATVKAAKDFVQFVYDSDKWSAVSVGSLPAMKSLREKYKDQIYMEDAFDANEKNVVDFMKNAPNWQGSQDSVRSVFYPWISKLLAKTITPQQCAKGLQEECNAALARGMEQSKTLDG